MPPTPGPSSLKRSAPDPDDASRDLKKSKRDQDKKRRRKRRRKASIVLRRPAPPSLPPDGDADDDDDDNDERKAKEDKGKGRAIDSPRPESPSVAENQLTSLIITSTSDLPSTSAQAEAQAAEIARLRAQLSEQTSLVRRHETHLASVQNSLTCQICLDLLYRPYTLSPCGHIACYTCLLRWFTTIPNHPIGAAEPAFDADAIVNGPPLPPAPDAPATTAQANGALRGRHHHHRPPSRQYIHKRKTCPLCRAVVRNRPTEVYNVKDMVGGLTRSQLVDLPVPPPSNTNATNENHPGNPGNDPWNNVFPPAQRQNHPGLFDYFMNEGNAVTREETLTLRDAIERRRARRRTGVPLVAGAGPEDVGMRDADDGGIYRCLDCMHEIWGRNCTGCGRVYTGHQAEDEDEDDDDHSDEDVDVDLVFGAEDDDRDLLEDWDDYGDLYEHLPVLEPMPLDREEEIEWLRAVRGNLGGRSGAQAGRADPNRVPNALIMDAFATLTGADSDDEGSDISGQFSNQGEGEGVNIDDRDRDIGSDMEPMAFGEAMARAQRIMVGGSARVIPGERRTAVEPRPEPRRPGQPAVDVNIANPPIHIPYPTGESGLSAQRRGRVARVVGLGSSGEEGEEEGEDARRAARDRARVHVLVTGRRRNAGNEEEDFRDGVEEEESDEDQEAKEEELAAEAEVEREARRRERRQSRAVLIESSASESEEEIPPPTMSRRGRRGARREVVEVESDSEEYEGSFIDDGDDTADPVNGWREGSPHVIVVDEDSSDLDDDEDDEDPVAATFALLNATRLAPFSIPAYPSSRRPPGSAAGGASSSRLPPPAAAALIISSDEDEDEEVEDVPRSRTNAASGSRARSGFRRSIRRRIVHLDDDDDEEEKEEAVGGTSSGVSSSAVVLSPPSEEETGDGGEEEVQKKEEQKKEEVEETIDSRRARMASAAERRLVDERMK